MVEKSIPFRRRVPTAQFDFCLKRNMEDEVSVQGNDLHEASHHRQKRAFWSDHQMRKMDSNLVGGSAGEKGSFQEPESVRLHHVHRGERFQNNKAARRNSAESGSVLLTVSYVQAV